MKSIVLTVLLTLACSPVMASFSSGTDITVGPFYLSDHAVSRFWGTGIGITMERTLRHSKQFDLDGCVSYIYFSYDYRAYDPIARQDLSSNLKASLIPVTLRAVSKFGSGALRPYIGVGYGLAFEIDRYYSPGDPGPFGGLGPLGQPSAYTGSQANACYELIGGLRFGDKCNVEVRYLDGGNAGNTGFSASLGARF